MRLRSVNVEAPGSIPLSLRRIMGVNVAIIRL